MPLWTGYDDELVEQGRRPQQRLGLDLRRRHHRRPVPAALRHGDAGLAAPRPVRLEPEGPARPPGRRRAAGRARAVRTAGRTLRLSPAAPAHGPALRASRLDAGLRCASASSRAARRRSWSARCSAARSPAGGGPRARRGERGAGLGESREPRLCAPRAGPAEGAVPAAAAGGDGGVRRGAGAAAASAAAGWSLSCVLYGAARLLWAGVDTVRSVIWSVNFPRHLRARVTGRIMVNGSIALAASGLLLGWLLEHDDPGTGRRSWRRLPAASPAASPSSASGCGRSSGCSRTNGPACARARASTSPACGELLARDAHYRRYMLAMSMFGAGQPDADAADGRLPRRRAARLGDRPGRGHRGAADPRSCRSSLQPWARFLDRHHVIVYRSVHAWIAVAGAVLLALACSRRRPWLRLARGAADGHLACGGQPRLVARPQRLRAARRGDPLHGAARHADGPARAGGTAGRDPRVLRAAARSRPGSRPWSMLLPVGIDRLGAWQFTAMRRRTWSRAATARDRGPDSRREWGTMTGSLRR